MSGGFEAFAEVVTRSGQTAQPIAAPKIERVAVLGGGVDARLIAALCLAEGADVTLFSAYGAELADLRTSSGISLRGAGPVGTYQVDRSDTPSVQTTAELDRAVSGAEAIFLTGPVHKQRTYAMVLADHLCDGQVLVLAPGRSLGALETAWFLRIGGCTADVTIVETQGLPFWVDAQGAVLKLSPCGPVAAATLPSGRGAVLQSLARFLPNLVAHDSVLASGFADGSALVEFPALLMSGPALGSGAVPVPMGAMPLAENQNFAALIGVEQRNLIDQLAQERRAVAKSFGVRNLPDTDAWIGAHAGVVKGDGVRAVPDQAEARRLLRDGIIGSLVPLISAAQVTGTAVPVTQAMITLASAVLGADVAAAGRRLDTIGIHATDIDTARQAMDAIATGNR
jgi:opine dehydrogenase